MTDAKIQGKFYPLQHEEWVKASKELTHTQLRILYYLRTLDPYSNGLQVKASKIAEFLEISRQAVYKAFDVLEEKGYIEREDTNFTLKLRSLGYLCDTSLIAHSCQSTATVVNVGRQTEPESLVSQASQPSKINSDLLDSLSEAERENFEQFVRDSWRKITAKNGEPGKEIISLERFLNKPEDLNNWWEKFLKSSAGRKAKKKAATVYDWHKDPRFNEWIWEAFERGYEWVHENEAEREERNLFYDWAFAVNAFKGVCL